MRKNLWRWSRGALVAAGATLLVADGGLRQDEIDCEQAVSYLEGCCPAASLRPVACVRNDGCFVDVYPDLSIAESQCILATSCQDAIAHGVCDRLSQLPPTMEDDAGDLVNTPHPPVCP